MHFPEGGNESRTGEGKEMFPWRDGKEMVKRQQWQRGAIGGHVFRPCSSLLWQHPNWFLLTM